MKPITGLASHHLQPGPGLGSRDFPFVGHIKPLSLCRLEL